MPWLGVLGCLALAPAAKAAEAADASKALHPQAAVAQPKLAEQDIWKRWKLAHDAHKARSETKSISGSASAKDSGLSASTGSSRRY